MDKKLRIALVQTSLVWENIDANLEHFSHILEQIPPQTDLVILPEMFSTGFTNNTSEVAERQPGKATLWLKKMAKKHDMAVLGSIVFAEGENNFNRLFFAPPGEKLLHYDKRHLFRMGNEHHHYTAGTERLIVHYKGWRICPLVCYDLRFPVWSRNQNQYDLLIYIANWPKPRREHWLSLLKARAIENQAYVAGVNCIGTDGRNIPYSGDSVAFDALGNTLFQAAAEKESTEIVEISLGELQKYREKFPAYLDADNFSIQT